jgi:polysaccharide export outer membrane protein
MKSNGFIVVACCVIASCASPRLGTTAAGTAGDNTVTVVQASQLPPPSTSDLYDRTRPYLVGPFDKLSIDVFGIPELDKREYQVDAGGRISFPLAGTIDASGKTPSQIETEIEARLRERFVRDPQVTVNLRETVSQVITVDGQVKEPGLYPVVGRMTLMRAIATAKGLGDFAKQSDVVVFRTVEGRQLAALYNLKAIRRGAYEDPEVFANDVVVVGESRARQLFRDLIGISPLLSGPLIVALQSGSN